MVAMGIIVGIYEYIFNGDILFDVSEDTKDKMNLLRDSFVVVIGGYIGLWIISHIIWGYGVLGKGSFL